MKKLIMILLFIFAFSIAAQTSNFNLEAYKSFLSSHQNLSTSEFYAMFDAGKFDASVKDFPSNPLYLDSVKEKMHLTEYEMNLFRKNGFFATERIHEKDYLNMLAKIWQNDLPVFITTDAILNALHLSYDLILKGVEIDFLIPKLTALLNSLNDNFNLIEQKFSVDDSMTEYLRDVDLYLSVPRKLMQEEALPYYSDNKVKLSHYLDNISKLELVEEPAFSQTKRYVDYSQFQVRGHYADENYPQLAKYFKAMIWLGRIELYLLAPQSAETDSTIQDDVKRQTIDSYLITELIKISGTQSAVNEIENTIRTFVGDQDNVTLIQLEELLCNLQISSAKDLLDDSVLKIFQDSLSVQPYAGQKILSQVLMSDPGSPDQIIPASAFLLFGQRFVIDSYVTANVVYDRIKYNNLKVARMLPSTLDILFALGNSAAAQILQPEIDKYHYATNLSSLRYLIDSYGTDFWNNSIYNLWLNSIRTLNAPNDRTNLPEFMRTAAWWQQKMNTQLSSWAELRHDNILYAKQSYSGGILCSYPYAYVEPIPSFYKALKNFADLTAEKLNSLSLKMDSQINFLNGFSGVMETLETVASKELNMIELTTAETNFLKSVLYTTSVICGGDPYNGWYNNRLIFKSPYYIASADIAGTKYVVADYHTTPTDEFGSVVGWVKHAGTGPVNLCVAVAEIPNVGNVAFAGPVSSYYEYTTTNFQRLTDKEWRSTYQQQSLRPDWVNVYLANSEGESRGTGSMLITDVKNIFQAGADKTDDFILLQNYPNPFNPETTIRFSVPAKLADSFSELKIYNVNGQLVRKIFAKEIPAGNYLAKWDGKNNAGQLVSSGVYLYQLRIGNVIKSAKMSLLK